MSKVASSIRYDRELLRFFTQVSKISKIPRDRLVEEAMRRYKDVLERQYPDSKFIPVKLKGDE